LKNKIVTNIKKFFEMSYICHRDYLFLSLAKNVSGTQIFSAKSPLNVRTSSLCEKASLSSFQYWFKYIVIV